MLEKLIISKGLSCIPCYKTDVMKACKDNICMKSIFPKLVLESINSKLGAIKNEYFSS